MSTPTITYIPPTKSSLSVPLTLQNQVNSATLELSTIHSQLKTESVESIGNTLNLGCLDGTTTLNLGTGSAVKAMNIGTGTGATTISIGGTADTVTIDGTLTTIQSQLKTGSIDSITDTLNLGCSDLTTTLNLGTGSAVKTMNIGTGLGATAINIGGAGDIVSIAGTLTTVNTTNTQVHDTRLVLNSGGATGSAGNSGIYFEENGVNTTSFMRQALGRDTFELQSFTGPLITLNQSLQTTDSPTFATITGGNLISNGMTTSNGILSFNNQATNKIIAMYDNGVVADTSDQRFSGLGISATTVRYQAGGSNLDHAFFAATSATTSDELFRISGTTGITTINKITAGGGLQLPTTGGTAGLLDYYEEFTFPTGFNGAFTTATNAATFYIVRIGSKVTITFRSILSQACTVDQSLTSQELLPTRFLPSSGAASAPICIFNNTNAGDSTRSLGFVLINSSAKIQICTANATTFFTSGSASAGFSGFSMTYSI